MAILTDLSNELLLLIIADVSPLYIDLLALSCKRIYILCAETIQKHETVRSELAAVRPLELLRDVFSNPGQATYPRSLKLRNSDFELAAGRSGSEAQDLKDIEEWAHQSVFTAFHKTSVLTAFQEIEKKIIRSTDLAISLLVTGLPNLRKMELFDICPFYLLEAVSQIVEANHGPLFTIPQSLAFGRLRDVSIHTYRDNNDHGVYLAILFAMIPSVRKVNVANTLVCEPIGCPYPHYDSNVTEIILDDYLNYSDMQELISRVRALQRFTYNYEIRFSIHFEPRPLVQLLKQHAAQTLTYLKLHIEESYTWEPPPPRGSRIPYYHRSTADLSVGSLREFATLQTLVIFVDMFIKISGHLKGKPGTGTVHRLVSWLPASLETLVLHPGLGYWDKNVLRLLFRGFRSNKQTRLPKLRLINFILLPNYDQVMPEDVKATFWETGVKVGYTAHWCKNPDCSQVLQQSED